MDLDVFKNFKNLQNLRDLRKNIDEIDENIIDLLNKRMGIAEEIKIIKKNQNQPIYDAKREKEIFEKVKKISKHLELKKSIKSIYQIIIETAKKIQHDQA